MKLSAADRERYERDGYLLFPELFSAREVASLRDEVERLSSIQADGVFREGDDDQAKSLLGLQEPGAPTYSPVFRTAARTPRCLGVAQQLLGDDALYMHHLKVNMKASFQGTAWAWHQDFGAWHLDGIAEPEMATMMVMLHDATELGGCLYFLPGSHQAQRVEPYFDTATTYKFWAVSPERMRELMRHYPEPVPITGKAGSAAIFHCNLLHASGHNLSPRDRWQAYFCFNRCANRPADVANPRPSYVRSRHWEPMALADDGGILVPAATA